MPRRSEALPGAAPADDHLVPPQPNPADSLFCLSIDLELRDVWELLDDAKLDWDERELRFVASALRVAFDRGWRQGKDAGDEEEYWEGVRQGYDEGYAAALADVPEWFAS